MGGDEVLENGHPFPEVAPDGNLDDPARRVGHEATHRAKLADVALVSAGTGVRHHRDRAVRPEALHHHVRHAGRRGLPDADDLLVALVIGDQAALELAIDLEHRVVGGREARLLVLRDLDVEQADRHPAAGGEVEADGLDPVHEVCRLLGAEQAVALIDEVLEIGPLHHGVAEAHPLREASG